MLTVNPWMEAVLADDAIKVKKILADGHDMNMETDAWKSVIRYAVHEGSFRSVKVLLQAGAPLPYGFILGPDDYPGKYPSLLMVAHKVNVMKEKMLCVLIEHGAWFTTWEFSPPYAVGPDRCPFAYDYRAQLAACRLAQRALGRVLRGRVHRNVIPMIEARVWSTRRDDLWLESGRQKNSKN